MIELVRTGFFREMRHGAPGDPSLAEARSTTASPHEDRIAAYLDAGHVYIATAGPSRDVFAPETLIGPPHYLTDGRFVWPGDLAHYVRSYHVRLEGALLEHMMANGWAVPAGVNIAELTTPGRASGTQETATAAPEAAKPADLAAALTAFATALSGASGIDTEALKASLARASDELLRATGAIGGELRRAYEAAGDQLRNQLASSLRSLTDWAQKPEVQAVVASLDARAEQAAAPQRAADDAERKARLASEIRGTIAARLRERGLDPGDDEPK
jgi:hypothetical protein